MRSAIEAVGAFRDQSLFRTSRMKSESRCAESQTVYLIATFALSVIPVRAHSADPSRVHVLAVVRTGQLFGDIAVGRAPSQMLAAIDRDGDAGDALGLREVKHRRRDVVRARPLLQR
jgi:hypothetical protein